MQLVYPSPPPKFYITIVLDFSLDDCNTLEKLEAMVLPNVGEGRGGKQGALWSMVYEFEVSFKRPAVGTRLPCIL